MFSNARIHHKSPPRPNSAIIPNSSDIKKRPTPQHPQNPPKTPKLNLKIKQKHNKWQNVTPPRETREHLKETRDPAPQLYPLNKNQWPCACEAHTASHSSFASTSPKLYSPLTQSLCEAETLKVNNPEKQLENPLVISVAPKLLPGENVQRYV